MAFFSTIAAAVGSAVSAVAAAGSIGAAIAGGAGLAATAINTALSFGLSIGAAALSSALGSKTPAAAPGEIAATVQVGGDIPRQVAFGRVAVRGQLVFAATNGVANERLLQVFILSDGWCDGLDAVWFGDQRHALEPLAPDNNAVAKYWIGAYGDTGFGDKRATIWFYDGRPGQGPCFRPFTYDPARADIADRYAGMTYVVVELINNNDTFDAIPDLLWELRGYRCHDPRKDPAFGGSGSHSLADPASWEFTENPALHTLAYLRGIQSEGQILMGMGLADYDVLTETFIAAANICAEAVPLEAGGSEPRYRASAVVTAQDGDHRAAIAPLIQACAGYLIERNGSFGLLAGAAQLPVETLTDADIVWDRGVKWSGSRSRTGRVNEVHGQFVDPAAQWQANSYPPITSGVFSAEDGERLAVALDFGSITSITQAQRAARIRMRETRRQASASLTFGMHLLWLEAGDWVRWQSATFAFDKLYRVVSRDLNPDDTVTCALQEVGNEIYSWSTADEQPYLPPATGPTEPPLPSTVTDLSVQPEVINGADGSTRPILRITWEPIEDTRIVAVIIEYRPIGQIAATRVRDDSPWDGEFILDQPPTGLDYEFRATIATIPPRPVTWTPWLSLEALDPARFSVDVRDLSARFRAEIVWPPVLHPDVLVTLWNTSVQAMSADGKAEASIKRIEQVSVTESEARATLGTQLNARMGTVEAQVTDVQTAVATNTLAVAAMQTTLTATVGDVSSLTGTVTSLSATVSVQAASIADLYANKASASYAISIEAQAIAAQSAANTAQGTANGALGRANSASAGGQFDLVAEAGPGGASSRIRARAWTDAGGTKTDGGWMIDIIGGVARFSVFAHQFALVDNSGASPFAPFFYSGGGVFLNANLQINGNVVVNGTLTADKIVGGALSGVGMNERFDTVIISELNFGPWIDYLVLNASPSYDGRVSGTWEYEGAALPVTTAGSRTIGHRVIRRKDGGETVVGREIHFSNNGGYWRSGGFLDAPGAGSCQYVLQHRGVATMESGSSAPQQSSSRYGKLTAHWTNR